MANQDSIEVTGPIYFGLFSVAMATLMYEILLTRIFSVTMWYHFAFMAISIAMFGMTVGAIIVYLFPNYFSRREGSEAPCAQFPCFCCFYNLELCFSSACAFHSCRRDVGTWADVCQFDLRCYLDSIYI